MHQICDQRYNASQHNFRNQRNILILTINQKKDMYEILQNWYKKKIIKKIPQNL